MFLLRCQEDSSNNKENALVLNPLIRVCEQGFTFKPCSSLLTRLWRRSCWLCNLYSCIASSVVVVVSFLWRRALPLLWSSSLRALCSPDWHWRLLCIAVAQLWLASVPPGLFLQPDNFAHDVLFTVEFQPSLALLFYLTGLLGFVHAACEDEVGPRTREILVFSSSFHSFLLRFCLTARKLYSKKVQFEIGTNSTRASVVAVVGPSNLIEQ